MQMRLVDKTGLTYGRLTVQQRVILQDGSWKWEVVCVCGTKKLVSANSLRKNGVTSCGCSRRTYSLKSLAKVEFAAFRDLKRLRPNLNKWDSFESFYKEVGPKPTKSHVLAWYGSSLKWLLKEAAHRHQRREYTYKTLKRPLKVFAEMYKFNIHTVRSRMRRSGKSLEQVLSFTSKVEPNQIKSGLSFKSFLRGLSQETGELAELALICLTSDHVSTSDLVSPSTLLSKAKHLEFSGLGTDLIDGVKQLIRLFESRSDN